LGKQFTLTTSDKHSLGAYRADPQGKAKGGMVVVQEIFGVNHHIRAVCDRLAALGYAAVPPMQKPMMPTGPTPLRSSLAAAMSASIWSQLRLPR